MSKRVKAYSVFFYFFKYSVWFVVGFVFLLLLLIYVDKQHLEVYSMLNNICMVYLLVEFALCIYIDKYLNKKVGKRITTDNDVINDFERKKETGKVISYIEQRLKKEYHFDAYLRLILSYIGALMDENENEKARSIVFNTKCKGYDAFLSFYRFVFYAYDGNVSMLDMEYKTIMNSGCSYEVKFITKYFFSIIKGEKTEERPEEFKIPLLYEIENKYLNK